MRGLKQNQSGKRKRIANVASFTDAWIETKGKEGENNKGVSHLLQMRGLKPHRAITLAMLAASHLLQMRGLKLTVQQTSGQPGKSHLLQMRGLKRFEYVGLS